MNLFLIISDINGKIVKYVSEIGGKESIIITKGMKPGIYQVSLKSIINRHTYIGKIVVAK